MLQNFFTLSFTPDKNKLERLSLARTFSQVYYLQVWQIFDEVETVVADKHSSLFFGDKGERFITLTPGSPSWNVPPLNLTEKEKTLSFKTV
jgi:hypothetical protein